MGRRNPQNLRNADEIQHGEITAAVLNLAKIGRTQARLAASARWVNRCCCLYWRIVAPRSARTTADRLAGRTGCQQALPLPALLWREAAAKTRTTTYDKRVQRCQQPRGRNPQHLGHPEQRQDRNIALSQFNLTDIRIAIPVLAARARWVRPRCRRYWRRVAPKRRSRASCGHDGCDDVSRCVTATSLVSGRSQGHTMASGGKGEKAGCASATRQHDRPSSGALAISLCLLVGASTCHLFGGRFARAAPAPVGPTCAHNRMCTLCYCTVSHCARPSLRLLAMPGKDKEPRFEVAAAIDVGWQSSDARWASWGSPLCGGPGSSHA